MKKLSALLLSAAVLTVLPGCNNEDWPEENNNPEPTNNPSPAPTNNPNNGNSPGTGGSTPTTAPNPVPSWQLGAMVDEVFTANILALSDTSIPANGSSDISFVLADAEGESLTDLNAEVVISSKCAEEGLARFEHNRFFGGGDMSTRYVNQGCVGNDIITAELKNSPVKAQALINIQAPAPSSLTSFEPDHLQISIRGQGSELRPDSTLISFKLVDNLGQPMGNQLVNFALVGSPASQLVSTSGYTDKDGMVSAHLRAGEVSEQVQIRATVANGPTVLSPFVMKVVPTIASSINAQPLSVSLLAPRGLANAETSDLARVAFQLQDQFGLGISNKVLNFTIQSESGSTLLINSATTDAQGIAEAVVQAAPDYDQLTVSASFIAEGINLSGRSALLTVGSAPALQLNASLALAATELASNGTTSVTPSLRNGNTNYSNFSTQASFSSVCAEQGLASFTPSTTQGPNLASNYQDLGCAGRDVITVVLRSNGKEWTLSAPLLIRTTATSLIHLAPEHGLLATLGHGSSERPDNTTVSFQLLDNRGRPVVGQELTFDLVQSNTAGTVAATLINSTGTTNEQGIALARVRAGSDFNEFQVRATSTNNLTNLSSSIKVTSSPSLNLRAGNGTGDDFVTNQLGLAITSLAVGGQTQVSVNLVDGDADYRNFSTQVQFSSTCSAQGLASFSPELVWGANLETTYSVKGCSGEDLITATLSSNDQEWTLSRTVRIVANDIPQTPASIQSLPPEFAFLAIRGFGTENRPELTAVPFKVVDAQGQPVVDQVVTFSLPNSLSGAEIVRNTARTNAEGVAIAQLKAGLGNDLIRLIASVNVGESTIATQSSYQVSVSSGLPRDGWFSFVTPVLNPGGIYDVAGASVPWSIVATDGHTGSAPQEGLQFKFFTNTGLLDFQDGLAQSGCTLVNGRCQLNWINNSPMPVDGPNTPLYDGVVRALAYTLGEENFIDTNGNGMLDIGEYFCPLAEPFLALDDTREYLEGAPFVRIHSDGARDNDQGGRKDSCLPAITLAEARANGYIKASDGADSIKYRGAACSPEAKDAGHCGELAVISRTLFFVTPDDNSLAITTDTVGPITVPQTVDFNVRDKNGSTPSFGTAFSVSCTEGRATIISIPNHDIPNNQMPNKFSEPNRTTGGTNFQVKFEDDPDNRIVAESSCDIKVGGASKLITFNP